MKKQRAETSEREQIKAILAERTATSKKNGYPTLMGVYTMSAISKIADLFTTQTWMGHTRWGWRQIPNRDLFEWSLKVDASYDQFDFDHPASFSLTGQVVSMFVGWESWENEYPLPAIEILRTRVLDLVDGERKRLHEAEKTPAATLELNAEIVDEERDDAHAPVAFDDATAAVEAAVKAERERNEILRQRTRERVNLGLVTEMLAGAGFELCFNTIESGGYALWEQILPERTNVKVQLALSAEELQLPPASVYRLVFDQVGAK